MDPLRREEKERLFAHGLGLTCAEEAALVEAWITCDAAAADFYRRLQTALGPLESLPPEPCPEDLAERTIQRLRAASREPPGTEHAAATRRSLYWEDLWLCLSSNILMK